MAAAAIVSYDGTLNDDDGLALAHMLEDAGVTLALAYVRHSREYDPGREEIGVHDAERRLEMGATWLKQPDVNRHVVTDPSTGAGLAKLASEQHASLIVFGSDYRTSPGRVEPGGAAQQMLQGGSVPVAVAVAGLRANGTGAIKTISVFGTDGDDAPQRTAQALATALGATVVGPNDRSANLIIVGSQPNAQEGRIALSGATRAYLDSASGSALVLPRGTAVDF
jgi:nucleotide-binding universal stress UspA family protein